MVLERFQIILSNKEPDNKSGILWLHKRQGYYVLEFFGERGWVTLGNPFAEEVGQTLEERVNYLEETIAKKTSGFTTIEAIGGEVKSTSPSYKCKFYSKTGTLEVTKGEGQSISIDLGQPFIESISNKLQKYSDELEKLQEQVDNNHSEFSNAFQELYDDVEKDYSKKSDTIRHISLSSSASENGLALVLEGEYDDSNQGSHLLGPDNITLPYATESKAGVMSSEDKNTITKNKEDIQVINANINQLREDVGVEILALQGQVDDNALAIENKQDILISGNSIKTINGESILGEGDLKISGLGFTDLGEMSPTEIISKLEDGTTGIFLVKDNTSGSADIRYTIYKTFVPKGEYSFFATKLEWKGSELVNTVGTFGGDKNGHGGFIPIQEGVTEEYVNNAIAEAITTTLNTEV